MMKWIVITQPQAFEHEAEYIAKLLSYGVDYIHLRKPDMAVGEFESLLQSIPESLHPRLTLHDHFSLAESYRVGGLHLNSRQSTLPDSFHGRVSRSCHSLEEVVRWRDGVEYLFLTLSPKEVTPRHLLRVRCKRLQPRVLSTKRSSLWAVCDWRISRHCDNSALAEWLK